MQHSQTLVTQYRWALKPEDHPIGRCSNLGKSDSFRLGERVELEIMWFILCSNNMLLVLHTVENINEKLILIVTLADD